MAGQRKYALGTGGGPSLPSPKLNDDEKDVFEIIQLQVTGTKSYFDSDQDKENSHETKSEFASEETTNFSTPEVPEVKNSGTIQIKVSEISPSPKPGTSTWSTYSPSLLRTPRATQLEENRTSDINALPMTQDEVEKENHLRRYRKRTHTGTMTNKAWCELADYKKIVAKTKIQKLKKDMELTEVLIKQNKLRNKLLELQIERESETEE